MACTSEQHEQQQQQHTETLLEGIDPMQKGLRKRNSPMCTLSQNGYGDRYGSEFVLKPL